ncbi:L-lactate dehydrogenase [cytochrome] (plasmid) [Tsukamurella tyrosinosolvens]|uniref:4-hydroxymandelate oxidase n=1 Tax=Tsukamurella tyrosinosolvens TaxID=57704 RepID=A0A1H4PLC0_TSUTY|nr:alpha-hydroxy acid oxidase [Tsukamurella tyrosinosolvens]KXO97385.1 alpha-hydroxy-acid oxidizing enzyme [Tsukamurella tyrosinosolvens]SEC08081.1 4-hydroxymandelate oxidase [Tsukamurella tyrosinosolvens]VEH97134.1 L-lactate dehydrogenase [cytochrome] [Tsukamurella tyrosinosolvens]
MIELAQRAERALPPDVWAYLMRGASSGESPWERWRFAPRVLRDVRSIDTATDAFGAWRSPIGVAPTAFHRLVDPGGEAAAARAAADCGAPFVLSMRATTRIEEVAAAAAGPWWQQVYLMRDRTITDALVQRAAAAGATALVLTGDTPYVGRSGGRGLPPLGDDLALVNVAQHLPPGADAWAAIEQDAGAVLDDIGRLADLSGLPVIVKGVLRPDEARRCVDAGAAGVWVSDHGGRQLGRTVAPAQALPRVAAAVGAEATVLVDGDGLDALAALALGADAVFVGRPVLWGLAVSGADGVRSVLTGLLDELRHGMGLAGATRVAELSPDLVVPR